MRLFAEAAARNVETRLQEIKQGHLALGATEWRGGISKLGKVCQHYAAVSRHEVGFEPDEPGDSFGRQYFDSSKELVRQGKTVTRMFLLTGEQIKDVDTLSEVLARHYRAGIGFAVVASEELPVDLRRNVNQDDFGLWDQTRVLSVFSRQDGECARGMDVVFSAVAANDGILGAKINQYRRLLEFVLLADEAYIGAQRELVSDAKEKLERSKAHLSNVVSGLAPEGDFYFVVKRADEIPMKIEALAHVLTQIRA